MLTAILVGLLALVAAVAANVLSALWGENFWQRFTRRWSRLASGRDGGHVARAQEGTGVMIAAATEMAR